MELQGYDFFKEHFTKDKEQMAAGAIGGTVLPEVVESAIMGLRTDLRNKELSEPVGSDKIKEAYVGYWKTLFDLYDTYFKMRIFISAAVKEEDFKLSHFFQYYDRSKKLFDLANGKVYIDTYPGVSLNFRVTFYSAWPIVMIELEKDPATLFENIVEIEADTAITETDWREAEQKGKYILRRNAECGHPQSGGVVMPFLFTEKLNDPETGEPTAITFNFYAMPWDSEEIRRYQITVSLGTEENGE